MLLTVCLLFAAGLIATDALPTCELVGEKSQDLICTPSTSDFILQRGLVSDFGKVTSISLRACNVAGVELEAFEQLPALETLDLSHNKIKVLALGVLDGFQQLKLLNLSYNKLTNFELGLFDQKPNLEVLDLTGNKITVLQLGVLDGFQQLRVLNLSHNQLTRFPLGLFDQKPDVEYLDLKENRLINLELGVLDPMTKLKYLDISGNQIVGKNLSPYLFDQNPLIEYMDFSWNNMEGTDDMMLHAFTALDHLNLDSCSLSAMPEFALKKNMRTLKHLKLSMNKISRIENQNTFEMLESLETLNLVGNSISYIIDGAFVPLSNLKILMLSHNKLKEIPVSLFQSLTKLTNVDLSYNALEIIPLNAFKGAPIKNLNLSNNKFTYLPENFCMELNQSGGKMRKFYFNQNPWQCACLRDAINEVKMHNIVYNSEKYKGNIPVCVTTKEFDCKRHLENNQYYSDLYNNLIS